MTVIHSSSPDADRGPFPAEPATITGLERIAAAFEQSKAQGRAALMPYFTAGYPTEALSEEILVALAGAGADLVELGVPFSDPLADGPVIQHSTQAALDGGMTVAKVLRLVRRLRDRGLTLPVILMGYTNPIVAYGPDRYVKDLAAAGGDGLIVPDLPVEEAIELEVACATAGLALIYLAAPTSSPERLRQLAERTTGFLYLVSLTGVTGSRAALPADLGEFIARARAVAHTPVAVGFGIARPEQAGVVGHLANGVIVGSALIKAVAEADQPVAAATEFIRALKGGIEAR